MFLNAPHSQPIGVGCSGPPHTRRMPPESQEEATVLELLACLTVECGAFGMSPTDALLLGARVGGEQGWREVPAAAWSRYRERCRADVEQSEFFRESEAKRIAGGL